MTEPNHRLTPEWFAENYYYAQRLLPDGEWAALHKLLTTTAVMVGLNPWSFEYRYCYKTEAEARAALDSLHSVDDVPLGWIARRGLITETLPYGTKYDGTLGETS